MPISRCTRALYRAYRHRLRKKLSDTTINRDLEVLRHLLFWAVDEGILLSNPLSRVRMVRERRKPRIIVSVEEEDKLLASAAPHLREIIVAALDTGMRRGEILSQRWEHIDFTRKLLLVTHSKTAGGDAREIPLTARLFEHLTARQKPEGIVFTFADQPISRIKTAWKGALRRAGLRHFRFHDLRHTFNTRLLEAGVMQEIRKAIMGHSSGEDVNSIYTHVELPAKREAMQKLERWVAEQRCEAAKKGEAEHVPTTTTDGSGAVPALRAGRDADVRTSDAADASRRTYLPERTPCGNRRTCRNRLSHPDHTAAHADPE